MINPKPVFLLAGGRDGNRRRLDQLIGKVFEEAGVPSPNIAYVGTASGDDRVFFQYNVHFLKRAGAGMIAHALISSDKDDLQKAQNILNSADIVFISGGDVDQGMRILEKRNMIDFLRSLYRNGKCFFGLSAGSIMLAKKWIRWTDPDDDSSAELFKCLGFAPVICDTHGENDDWEELKAALKLAEDGEKGYGIVSGAAVKVNPDLRIETYGNAVHQFVRQKSEVIRISDILPSA